jgi:hypothetical protein
VASYEDRLSAQFGDTLRTPIRAASPAGIERKGLAVWVIAAVLLGVVVSQFIESPVPQGVILGGFGGIGLAGVMFRDHRKMLASGTQPGGGAVVLAVTDTDLVVLKRSMWTLKTFGVLAQVPLEEVQSVVLPDRLRSKPVTFTMADGGEWRYVIPNSAGLLAALPDRLQA